MRQILSDPRAREKPCLNCGLSLRKHLDDRHCPQCGLSVWLSLNPNYSLDWSRASWLRRTARGAWLLAAAQPLALVAYALGMVGSFANDMTFRIDAGLEDDRLSTLPTTLPTAAPIDLAALLPPEPSVAVAIAALSIGLYFIANAVGMGVLAADERRYPDRVKSQRLFLRIMAGVSVLAGVGFVAAALPRLHAGWPTHTGSSWLASIAAEVVFGLSAIACWLYLRPIAYRGGRGSLGKLCGYLLFLPLIAFAKAAPFIGLWFIALLYPFAVLLPLAYIPFSIVLFVKFALLLQRSAPHAEAAWRAESLTPTTPAMQ